MIEAIVFLFKFRRKDNDSSPFTSGRDSPLPVRGRIRTYGLFMRNRVQTISFDSAKRKKPGFGSNGASLA